MRRMSEGVEDDDLLISEITKEEWPKNPIDSSRMQGSSILLGSSGNMQLSNKSSLREAQKTGEF